jgi:hypothetical protein
VLPEPGKAPQFAGNDARKLLTDGAELVYPVIKNGKASPP